MRFLVLAAFAARVIVGETLPTLKAPSLSGHEVVLPDAARGKIATLIVGFSKSSSKTCETWARRAEKDFGGSGKGVVYQIAVLEAVPRLFRGMVIGGIRKGTPPNLHDRFLTPLQDERVWKQVAQYADSDPDGAYVIVLGEDGTIRWRVHGVFSEERSKALREQVSRATVAQ